MVRTFFSIALLLTLACGPIRATHGEETKPAPAKTPLTEARLRVLLQEVTSVTAGDVEAFRNRAPDSKMHPLGLELFLTIPRVRERSKRLADWRVLANSEDALLKAMKLEEGANNNSISPHTHALLQSRYIKQVSMTPNQDDVVGTVHFHAPHAYEGQLSYKAARDEQGKWTIVELTRPATGARYTFIEKLWHVDPSTIHRPCTEAIELPEVSGGVPLESIEHKVDVLIDADGNLRVREHSVSRFSATNRLASRPLAIAKRWGITSRLYDADEFPRNSDWTSQGAIVLHVHKRTTWKTAELAIRGCINNRSKLHRLYVVGLLPDSGAMVAIPAHLPVVNPSNEDPTQSTALLSLTSTPLANTQQRPQSSAGTVRRSMYARIASYKALHGSGAAPRLKLMPQSTSLRSPSYSDVVEAVDAAYRAGLPEILLSSNEDMTSYPGTTKDEFRALASAPTQACEFRSTEGSTDAAGSCASIPIGEASVLWTQPSNRVDPVRVQDSSSGPTKWIHNDVIHARGEPAALSSAHTSSSPKHSTQFHTMHVHKWLALHQSENGSWSHAGLRNDKELDASNIGENRPDDVLRSTALVMQAFLGAGYTTRGTHSYVGFLERGIAYLRAHQDKVGRFAVGERSNSLITHAMCTYVMSHLANNLKHRSSAKAALNFLISMRSKNGTWGDPNHESPILATTWALMALQQAKKTRAEDGPASCGLDLEFAATQEWLNTLDSEQNGDLSARKAARAAAIGHMHMLLGVDPRKSDLAKANAETCLKAMPRVTMNPASLDLHYWMLGTRFMFDIGGKYWKGWEYALKRVLAGSQRTDTGASVFRGTCDPVGSWEGMSGRTITTAVLTDLAHQFYRYDKVLCSPPCAAELRHEPRWLKTKVKYKK